MCLSDAELNKHLPRTSPKSGEHRIIPRTCGYGTVHGEGDFAGVIMLRTSRWGNYPDYPGSSNILTKVEVLRRESERNVAVGESLN